MNDHSGSVSPGLVIAGALVIGVLGLGAAGYAYLTLRQAQAEAAPAVAGGGRVVTAHTENEVTRLRQMLEEKETAYARLRDQYEQLKREAAPDATTAGRDAASSTNIAVARGDSGESFLDRLKREDPERYKRMEEARAQFRQQVEARYQEQVTRLQDRRQRAQAPDEIALVDQLATTVNKLHEISQGWENLGSLSGADRSTQAQQLAQDATSAYQTYRDLLAKDRQLQLGQLAARAGYRDPAQAAQFTEAIQRIYTETDLRQAGLSFGGGFGGGRGGNAPSNRGAAPAP